MLRASVSLTTCLVILALLSSPHVVAEASPDEFKASVVMVSGGHILTVDAAGERVLIVVYGVRCPKSSTAVGEAAKAFTAGRVLGQQVQVTVVKRAGTIVYAKLHLGDDSDLAELLLRQGLGQWDTTAAPNDTRFQQFENEAKTNGLGMWAEQESRPIETDQAPEGPPESTKPLHSPTETAERAGALGNARTVLHDEERKKAYVDEKGVPHLYVKGDGTCIEDPYVSYEEAASSVQREARIEEAAELERAREEARRAYEAQRPVLIIGEPFSEPSVEVHLGRHNILDTPRFTGWGGQDIREKM